MFNIKSLLAALVLASAMAFSACGSSGPPPMPFSSIEVPSAAGSRNSYTSLPSDLPWSVQGSVVSDGPYKGYKVEGPDYYGFLESEFSPTELNDFYTSKLTPAGWTAGKATIYLNARLGVFETGQPWVKGNQVIYLATYQFPPPSSSNSYLLAVYLLTK